MKKNSVKGLAVAGVIAALYVVFTLPFGQIAFGPIQFRIAEILTLLPFLSPWAIWGVTLGCFLSNLLFSSVWDVLFGTLATLIAALCTYKSRHLLVAPIWSILWNGLIIGTMLTFLTLDSFAIIPWLTFMAEITASEFVVCFALGVPFLKYFKKYQLDRFLK
jgi:uncharacterized membrane protein